MIIKFPPVRWADAALPGNANARVNLFGVRLRRGIARPAPIAAQDMFEWSVRAIVFALVELAAIGAAVVTGHWLIALVGLLVAYALAELPWTRGPGQRWIELRGHAVEVAAAEALHGDKADAYLMREASGMVRYYPAFRDMTADELAYRMVKLLPWARKWIRRPFWNRRIRKVLESARNA